MPKRDLGPLSCRRQTRMLDRFRLASLSFWDFESKFEAKHSPVSQDQYLGAADNDI